MRRIQTSAFEIAQRFVGLREIAGAIDNPQIMAMLRLDTSWPQHDEVAWCSAFGNYPTWLLRLPRSKSLMARSWLGVGEPIRVENAEPGSDIVVIKRGEGTQPGPEVIDAPGHVGFFAGLEGDKVLILGGNQGDNVNISPFPVDRILGIRRLY